MKPPSDLPGAAGATLVLSLKIVLQTLLVVIVLRLTGVLPFVPIFDFRIRSVTGVKDLTTEDIQILGEKLKEGFQKKGFGLAPPPLLPEAEQPNQSETGDQSENIFDQPEEILTPQEEGVPSTLPEADPNSPPFIRQLEKPSLNVKLPAEADKSFSTVHAW